MPLAVHDDHFVGGRGVAEGNGVLVGAGVTVRVGLAVTGGRVGRGVLPGGGGARLDGLVNRLATEIRIPVEMHQPLQNLQWIKSFDKQYLQSVAPQLAIAVGLALRGGEE